MIYSIITIFSITAILVAILTYQSRSNFFIKMITLPFVLISFSSLVYHVYMYRGTPLDYMPEHFEMIHHEVVSTDEGKLILLWAKVEDVNRLYRFPYDRETKKELDKGEEAKSKGMTVTGTKNAPAKDGNSQFTIKGEYQQNENYIK